MSDFGIKIFKTFLKTAFCLVTLAILLEIIKSFYTTGMLESRNGIILWAILFRAPNMLMIGSIPITALLIFFEKAKLNNHWLTVSLWIVMGVVFGGPIGIPAGLIVGLFYHYVLSKKALPLDAPDKIVENTPDDKTAVPDNMETKKRGIVLRCFGYIVALYFIWIVANAALYAIQSTRAKIVELPLGNPPFQMQYDHEFGTPMKVALIRFPDVQSCLEIGAQAKLNKDLLLLDWQKVDTKSEATVCVFRLLSKYGDISKSDEWLMAQGFTMSENNFNASEPYIERDGTKRVTGNWSIRKNGVKFKKERALRNLLPTLAYGMSVNATYSKDGQTLLFVRLFFSSL